MMSDVDVELLGDEELLRVLRGLPEKVGTKVMRRVMNDSANPMVKEIRNNAPVGPTGNLRRSIGKVAGKSRRSVVLFVGPRTGGGKKTKHKGFIANILEHSKEQPRYPKTARFLSTPWGPRRYVGPMKRNVFVRPAIERTLRVVEKGFIGSLRKIIIKEWNKAR